MIKRRLISVARLDLAMLYPSSLENPWKPL